MRSEKLEALKKRYQAQVAESIATLNIYVKNSVGIGEHPQHLDEMDKLLQVVVDAEEKIKGFGNYSLVNQSADRGKLEGDQSGGFFDFLTAKKGGSDVRKVWLAPDHASSNAPFLNLANGLPPGRHIFFTFVTGDNGDVKYMIGGDEQNKDLIRLSMKEFFNYAASIGAFGNMIEP